MAYQAVPPSSPMVEQARPIAPPTIYKTLNVTTSGSDVGGDGSIGSPWATIDHARSVITSNGWNSLGNIQVNVGAGAYYSSSVNFVHADSGQGSFTVRYKSSTPGAARIIGGRVLTGWSLYSGSIYRVALASPVYTLWENGVRARAARLPKLNPGASYPCAFAPYFTAAGVTGSPTVLQYNPVDFDPSGWTLGDVRLFVWSAMFSTQTAWFTDTQTATALNTGTKQFTLGNSGLKFNAMSGTAGARYCVQGDLSMLTEPGEFVYSGGFLYYWARGGSVLDQEIMIPTTSRPITMIGTDTSTRVSNVILDGLSIECSDFNSWYRYGTDNASVPAPPNDYPYWAQLSLARNGLVYMENTDHCQVTQCRLKNAGFAGVYMREYGQNNQIVNNKIEQIGTEGIYLEGRAPGGGDFLNNNTLDNNIVNDFGQLSGNGMGIMINQSGNNTVRHGHIYNGPRSGIRVTGWNGVSPGSDMYTHGNSLQYLKVEATNQDSGEAGGINLSFFNRTGVQTVDQCIVTNIHAHPSMIDFGGAVNPWGVFCDNQSDGQVLSNIQVTDTEGAQFFANDSGGHSLANCSFLSDGSSNPSFNAGLMDTTNIGVTSANPYGP